MDLCAQILIETSSKDDLLVKIDEISVKQHQLLCLLDQGKWLDDDVSLLSIPNNKEAKFQPYNFPVININFNVF
jgi:hypothetical protein